MRSTIWHHFTTAFLVFAVALADDKACTFKHNGRHYDLNPLSANTDYKLQSPGGHEFHLNVCRSLAQDSWNAHAPDQSKIAGVLRGDHGDISIGEVNTTISMEHNHPRLTFTNGSPCKGSSDDGLRASTIVEFHCDHHHKGSGSPRLVGVLPPEEDSACAFFVEWRTAEACATHDSNIGFFSGLFITLGVVMALYLLFGTLYNRFILGLSGYDQIPQFSISSTKYHATEAFNWIRERASATTGPGGMSYYERIPSAEAANGGAGGFRRPGQQNPTTANTINPFSHQNQTQREIGAGAGENAAPAGGVGGFVRPSSVAADKRPATGEINPVSHQSQVMADPSITQPGRQFQQQRQPQASLTGQQLQSRRLSEVRKDVSDLGKATPQEKEFMLGDEDEDEDEDAQEPPDVAFSGARTESGVAKAKSGMGSDGVIRL